ncbi:hypothetical protein F441_05243, partial [Phytophthora nicotianae CJ01A1]
FFCLVPTVLVLDDPSRHGYLGPQNAIETTSPMQQSIPIKKMFWKHRALVTR